MNHMFIYLFFFFLPHQKHMEVPGQGLNLSRSCSNVRSLTHCTTAGTPTYHLGSRCWKFDGVVGDDNTLD